MTSLSSLPIIFTKQTPNKIKSIFFDHNQKELTLLQSKLIQLPITKNLSNECPYQFLEEAFPYIKKWDIQELRCSKKLYPLILLQISHISFERLTFLHLLTCYIQSIEAIAWLDAPNLQQVSLDDNDVRSIKPMQKTYFKNLQYLSCSNNFFMHDQIKELNRIKLSQEKVFHVKLGKSGKKKIPFIEGLFKLQVGQKINASIGFTQFSSTKTFQQIGNRFANSFTSTAEGEIWMPGQQDFLKDKSMEDEDQSESQYFPYLNI